jgi:hypothetical protein
MYAPPPNDPLLTPEQAQRCIVFLIGLALGILAAPFVFGAGV